MEVLELARLQFAFTTVYHFLFVPITLGLSIIVAVMQTMYFKSKDPARKESMKKLTKYFGVLFIINYTIGIVTGIVQEFQFGMGWADYSRFVGNVFGAPLAVEALLAFFIESTFIGIWIFGWNKLPKAVHLACIWLVAIASNISAYVILAANTWMQHPVGFEIDEQGRAAMNDFFRVVLNPEAGITFAHVFTSAVVTSFVLVAVVAGYNVIKKKSMSKSMFPVLVTSLAMVIVFTFISLNVTGDASANMVMKNQPIKGAAMIGALNETTTPDQTGDATSSATPKAAEASKGATTSTDVIKQFTEKFGDENFLPPAKAVATSFQVMNKVGYAMIAISALLLLLALLLRHKRVSYFWIFVILLPLPFIANTAGWLVTELGRLPFTVYGELLLKDSISPTLQSSQVWFSLIVFTLIYAVLAVIGYGLMIRFVKHDGKFNDHILGNEKIDDQISEGGAN